MELDAVRRVAGLVAQRNDLDQQLAALIGRPLVSGHLGEWIAEQIFDIELEESGTRPGYDGRFRSGELAGRTVNIKWYLAQQGILDIAPSPEVDYYLVLAGPRVATGSSRGMHRPLVIERVYLFNRSELVEQLKGLRIGVATSVRSALWESSEIYPSHRGPLALTAAQEQKLALFAPLTDTEPATWSTARRVLQAVQTLHERGHENVRVAPGLASSGMYWRMCVFDANRSGDPYEDHGGKAVKWSTGEVSGGRFAGLCPETIADQIGEVLELGPAGHSDRAYVEWFRALMDRCADVNGLPVSYGDYLPQGWWVLRRKGEREPWPEPPSFKSHQGGPE